MKTNKVIATVIAGLVFTTCVSWTYAMSGDLNKNTDKNEVKEFRATVKQKRIFFKSNLQSLKDWRKTLKSTLSKEIHWTKKELKKEFFNKLDKETKKKVKTINKNLSEQIKKEKENYKTLRKSQDSKKVFISKLKNLKEEFDKKVLNILPTSLKPEYQKMKEEVLFKKEEKKKKLNEKRNEIKKVKSERFVYNTNSFDELISKRLENLKKNIKNKSKLKSIVNKIRWKINTKISKLERSKRMSENQKLERQKVYKSIIIKLNNM